MKKIHSTNHSSNYHSNHPQENHKEQKKDIRESFTPNQQLNHNKELTFIPPTGYEGKI